METDEVRQLDSYIKKYGERAGTDMYRRLQREAGFASAHARLLKRLARKTEAKKVADRIDGYDRDDLGESPEF
jgi:hypothetical protein